MSHDDEASSVLESALEFRLKKWMSYKKKFKSVVLIIRSRLFKSGNLVQFTKLPPERRTRRGNIAVWQELAAIILQHFVQPSPT